MAIHDDGATPELPEELIADALKQAFRDGALAALEALIESALDESPNAAITCAELVARLEAAAARVKQIPLATAGV